MPIEQIRSLLIIALGVVLFLMWQAWQKDYGPKPPPPQPTSLEAPESRPDVPDAPAVTQTAETPDVPSGETPAVPAAVPQVPGEEEDALPAGGRIRVFTDLFQLVIDPKGGDIRRLDLLDYSVTSDKPDVPFTLYRDKTPNLFVPQSGLLGGDAAPNHHAEYTAERAEFRLADDQDTLEVPLHWTSPDGVKVTKVLTFQRGSYEVGVEFRVNNTTEEPWKGRVYGQFQRTAPPEGSGSHFIYTYTGGVISSEEKPYEKIDFDDMSSQNLERAIKGGWTAMIQHYFLGAWIPDAEEVNHFYTKVLDGPRYVIGLVAPEKVVAPGTEGVLSLRMFVGPKLQDQMEAAAPGLKRTVDYGWLFIIATPLHWLLSQIYDVVGNWGWAIIILTILIKLAFFHLSATSYKSMARMRKLQPRLIQLRERYGSDKARLNQAMMELYKKEKVNPLGGCLPILVQIPVFIALYWVLLESVELRQAPFMLWLTDLSDYDPFFVLPVLMGVTMLVQQKLNPTPPDPIQAKVMMALPFVFTFFFLFFPSGLVLYWFVNNLLSIAQQWVITRKIIGESG